MPYVKPKKACEHFGVSIQTLRSWANAGKIKYIRSKGGVRLYDIDEISNEPSPKKSYIYCRVSCAKQRSDLERQVATLQLSYPHFEVVTDIASGINFNRKGLQKILDEALQGNVQQVVVAYKDRLCRIAWQHFAWLFSKLNVDLIVHYGEECTPADELKDDLFAIIHVFSCRHYGSRRTKPTQPVQEEQKEEDISS